MAKGDGRGGKRTVKLDPETGKPPINPKTGEPKRVGRPKVKSEQQSQPPGAPNKSQATAIIASLDIPDKEWEKLHPPWNKELFQPCLCWQCLWRHYARSERGGAEYLWNRAEGRPVQTVNHLHDKPIEMNVNVKLSEIIRQVRERKREYERNRK